MSGFIPRPSLHPGHGFNWAAGLAPPQLMQTQISTGDLRSRALGTLCSVLGAMITVFCCVFSVRYVCCLVSNLIIQHPSESVSSVPVSPLFALLCSPEYSHSAPGGIICTRHVPTHSQDLVLCTAQNKARRMWYFILMCKSKLHWTLDYDNTQYFAKWKNGCQSYCGLSI